MTLQLPGYLFYFLMVSVQILPRMLFSEAYGEHQQGNQGTDQKLDFFWKYTVDFDIGINQTGRGPKYQKGDFFIPNLIHFLIQIVMRGDMEHFHINNCTDLKHATMTIHNQ